MEYQYKWESLKIHIENDLNGNVENLRTFINEWLNIQGKDGWKLISYPESDVKSYQHIIQNKINFTDFVKINGDLIDNNLKQKFDEKINFVEGYFKFQFVKEKTFKIKTERIKIVLNQEEIIGKTIDECISFYFRKIEHLQNLGYEIISSTNYNDLVRDFTVLLHIASNLDMFKSKSDFLNIIVSKKYYKN